MNRHDKLKAEWELLGKPPIEYRYCSSVKWIRMDNPSWMSHNQYRFAEDRHWELRQKWLDSNKTLPLMYKLKSDSDEGKNWTALTTPAWSDAVDYREGYTESEQSNKPVFLTDNQLNDAMNLIIKYQELREKQKMLDGEISSVIAGLTEIGIQVEGNK